MFPDLNVQCVDVLHECLKINIESKCLKWEFTNDVTHYDKG